MAFIAYVYVFTVFFVMDTLSSQYIPCENVAPPLNLRIDECPSLPCQFKRGAAVNAEWDFRVPDDTETVKPVVQVTVFGNTINYPLPEQNGCNSLKNAECPLDEGEKVTYTLNMPIKSFYPKVSMDIQFSLVDDNDKPMVCFKVSGKVV